jgi:hypothetical protein
MIIPPVHAGGQKLTMAASAERLFQADSFKLLQKTVLLSELETREPINDGVSALGHTCE